MPKNQPDYLTETHKIRKALWKREFQYYIFIALGCVIFSYAIFDMNISKLFLTENEIKQIETYQSEIEALKKEKQYKYISYYEQKIREIKEKEPYFVTIYHVFLKIKQKDTLKRKIVFSLLYFFFYLTVCIAPFFFVKRFLNQSKHFIYQIANNEDVMPLKDEIVLPLEKILKTDFQNNPFFTDAKKVEKIINTAIVFHDFFAQYMDKIENYIDKTTAKYMQFVSFFYPQLGLDQRTEKLFRFILWHYAINFFGNVPTGILSIYITDPDFKVILSSYQRKILPTIYTKKRKSPFSEEYTVEYIKEKFFPYVFLRSVYEFDRIHKTMRYIEDNYSPLPFASPIQFQ